MDLLMVYYQHPQTLEDPLVVHRQHRHLNHHLRQPLLTLLDLYRHRRRQKM
jgi:hypothetical protein